MITDVLFDAVPMLWKWLQ